jgi:glutamine synthetase adenylyltransferase
MSRSGRGGIREIEFFAQTQQLIAGGRHPHLRVRPTLKALQVLDDQQLDHVPGAGRTHDGENICDG